MSDALKIVVRHNTHKRTSDITAVLRGTYRAHAENVTGLYSEQAGLSLLKRYPERFTGSPSDRCLIMLAAAQLP